MGQIRGIILEGQSCSGKTSVYRAIKRYLSMKDGAERNIIFLSEQYSQILNKVNGQFIPLSPEENLKVLSDRVTMLEQLSNYTDSLGFYSQESRGLFFVFERFHLNYAFCFGNIYDRAYKQLENRICALNAMTVLCVISDDNIEQRIAHRANSVQECVTEDMVIEYKRNQSLFMSVAKQSRVPTIIHNTDSMDWDGYAEILLSNLR